MDKYKFFKLVFLAVGFLMAAPALAVAIDDSITPQNCDRSNPACAQFLDTTSAGQIKWGGLVAGGLRSLTNLFVDGRFGVGTLRPSTGEQRLIADVEGALGAKFYCDENGNHCVPGAILGNAGTSTVAISVTAGNGIIVNRSGDIFNVSIDPTKTQVRVTGVCPSGEAVRVINQDGTVDCQTVAGGATNITSGPSIVIDRTANNLILTVNPDVVQFRITNTCPAGQAIRAIAANGTLTCESVNGAGDQFWAVAKTGLNDIYNRTLGKVSIGTDMPGPAAFTVKQRPADLNATNFAVADFANYNGTVGTFIARNGTGLESFSTLAGVSALYGHVNGAGATAVVGDSLGSGETYGAKLTSFKVGTYAKGGIGLYATDLAHATGQTQLNRDNRIPAALASNSKEWAGYFDGDVNINGKLNVNGDITVNGQPINVAADNSFKQGEHCGIFTFGAANGFDTNVPCQGTFLFKFWQRAGVPSNDANMNSKQSWQCPAGFSLAGGDFQSQNNRYFVTCVKN
jgi:hypothetical protein